VNAEPFSDRSEAGRALGRLLAGYGHRRDVLVLALSGGGVVVAAEVAAALDVALDVFVVHRLAVPGRPEYAMGAITTGGIRVLNAGALRVLRIPEAEVERATREEQAAFARLEALYRAGRAPPDLRDRTALVVDDGLATGATMALAIKALRTLEPARIVVAVPVGASASCIELRRVADQVVCALTPEPFGAVVDWYRDFAPPADEDVRRLLASARGDAPQS
jgi:predicted phosphoribosyltransferase